MAQLHLFNPENDLALAANSVSYTPPAAAIRLRRAGALLPMWWAEADDEVLTVDAADSPTFERISTEAELLRERHGLCGRPTMSVDPKSTFSPQPWGWSLYTHRLFLSAGMDSSLLPDDYRLMELRRLSHRRLTIDMHRCLNTAPELMPIEATTLEQALQAIDRMGRAVVKLPWSSSGRGVLYTHMIPLPTLRQYLAGIIHRQGSVMIEPMMERVSDFAALFSVDGHRARFEGLSAFATDNKGFYAGNYIASASQLIDIIGADPYPAIEQVKAALDTTFAPHYQGWLGVDMLTYRTPVGMAIAPCIEVNLRLTMGIAALHIHRRLQSELSTPHLLKINTEGIAIEKL